MREFFVLPTTAAFVFHFPAPVSLSKVGGYVCSVGLLLGAEPFLPAVPVSVPFQSARGLASWLAIKKPGAFKFPGPSAAPLGRAQKGPSGQIIRAPKKLVGNFDWKFYMEFKCLGFSKILSLVGKR